MNFDKIEWARLVSLAAASGDERALSRLFMAGREAMGNELDHEWASALSAWDATAVTG